MSNQPRSTSALGFPAIRVGPTQKITTSSSSQQSTAMKSGTTIFRIKCDQDVYIEVGINPTANSNSFFLDKNYVEYFAIEPNEKIAVLQVSASGSCYITEGA